MADIKKPVDQPLPQPEKNRTLEDELAVLRRTVSDLAIEVAQLRARVRQDDETPRRSRSRTSRRADTRSASRAARESRDQADRDETADTARDVADRSTDELHKLFRGATLAYVEQLRTYADAASDFVEEVLDRNNPDEKESVRHLTTSLPGDLYSGWLRAVERSLDAPSRMIDRFHESYEEADDIDEDSRSRSARTRAASARRERVVDDLRESSLSRESADLRRQEI